MLNISTYRAIWHIAVLGFAGYAVATRSHYVVAIVAGACEPACAIVIPCAKYALERAVLRQTGLSPH